MSSYSTGTVERYEEEEFVPTNTNKISEEELIFVGQMEASRERKKRIYPLFQKSYIDFETKRETVNLRYQKDTERFFATAFGKQYASKIVEEILAEMRADGVLFVEDFGWLSPVSYLGREMELDRVLSGK